MILGQSLLRYETKSISNNKKKYKLGIINSQVSCVSKDTIKEVKRQNPKEKYLQIIYLIRDWNLVSIRNAHIMFNIISQQENAKQHTARCHSTPTGASNSVEKTLLFKRNQA